ncbi:energy transducer TonB [Gluconobacter sp. Dm-62]|nr:energy transducer TonB [Gluconobacter sp. Dm-62]
MRLPVASSALALTLFLVGNIAPAVAEEQPLGAMLDPHHHTPLIYPPAELEFHKGGTAHVHCTISAAGIATECQSSASQPDFGLAAEQMAYSSTFLPAYKSGVAIQSDWEKTYNFHASPDMTTPQIDKAHTPAPHYPEAADIAGIGARITVICQIDQMGAAHDCSASDGPAILQRASLAYFDLARYYPALKDGQPVTAQYRGDIDWDVSHPLDQKGFR